MGVEENMSLDVRRIVGMLLECELLGLTHTGWKLAWSHDKTLGK